MFRQSDITRALKGAIAAGVNVARVEVDAGGTIVVVVSAANENPAMNASTSGWPVVRVRPKGLHRLTKRLADGKIAVYHYASRGGPRLGGTPGTVEFHASYSEAVAERLKPRTDIINGILRAYQMSDDFRRLTDRTRRDYVSKITLIEREFGDMPVTALGDRRTRGVFMAWRDELAIKSRRQADYAWSILAHVSPGR